MDNFSRFGGVGAALGFWYLARWMGLCTGRFVTMSTLTGESLLPLGIREVSKAPDVKAGEIQNIKSTMHANPDYRLMLLSYSAQT